MNILDWKDNSTGYIQKLTEFNYYFNKEIIIKPSLSFDFEVLTYSEQHDLYVIDGIQMNNLQKIEVLNFITTYKLPFDFYANGKKYEITTKYMEEVQKLTTATDYELASWAKQEAQSRAWIVDNSTVTPIIDALLLTRNMGETKEELINKIIAKADAYETLYGQILGKFHNREKALDSASTLEELNAVVW